MKTFRRLLAGLLGRREAVSFESPVTEIKKELGDPSQRLSGQQNFKDQVQSVVQTNLADASDDEDFRSP